MQEHGKILAVCIGLAFIALGCTIYWLRKRNSGLKKRLEFVQQSNELVGGAELQSFGGRDSM